MFTSLSITATVLLVLTLRAELRIIYTVVDLSSVHKTVVHASVRNTFIPIYYQILSCVECDIESNYVATMQSQYCTRQQTELVE